MPKRKKLKAVEPVTQAARVIHDRRAVDTPYNARIAIVQIDDAYGSPEFAKAAPVEHRDGSRSGDARATELRSTGQPKVEVVRNLREDPLAALHVGDHIDTVQYLAGRQWQYAHIRAEIGGLKAIDPSKEAVDGGRLAEPLSEVVIKAMGDMRRATRALGLEGDALIRDVLGYRLTLVMAADKRGLRNEAGRKYVGKRFRECLNTLAEVFGLATRGVA